MGSATALASSSGALEAKVLACLCRPLLPKRAIDACPANAEPSRNIGRTELLLVPKRMGSLVEAVPQ